MNRLIQHLRRSVLYDGAGRTDGQLLNSFVHNKDGAALTVLVRRHGPMVWGVCCRLLRSHQDAEDAFQATVLVLVQKAATLPDKEMVGNWLYGVAHQTAVRMRAIVAKRGVRERQVAVMPEPTSPEQYVWNDLQPVLDEELSRLPDKYRVLIILCDLDGKTRKEVALQLAIPEGTVASRLATARTMLAKRLARRGVVMSGVLLGAVLSSHAASACVPMAVVSSTIKAASLLAAGQGVAAVVSPTVAALQSGVMKMMFVTKIKIVLAVVLILGFVATAATVLTGRTEVALGGQSPAAEAPVKAPPKQESEKEAFTAWGKEEGGLQAGLGYLPGEHRTYGTGETVTLVVQVRNVSKGAVKFQYLHQYFEENAPTVTDDGRKPIHFLHGTLNLALRHHPVDVNLAPGKEIELYKLKFKLRPASESGNEKDTPFDGTSKFYGTGKFQIQYERVFGNSEVGKIKLDTTLSKLGTGKLELEVKEKEAEKVPGKKDEKEASTGRDKGDAEAPKKAAPKTDEEKLQGVWKLVRMEMGGQVVSEEETSLFPELVFDRNRIENDKGKQPAPFPRGAFTLDTTKNPKKITLITDFDGARYPSKGVYELEGDDLKICIDFNHVGKKNYEETTELKTIAGTFRMLYSFKREKAKKEDLPKEKKTPAKMGDLKADLTAWGKEVNGLQAGLGFHPGEKRAYRHGETVKVVLRVRNVGKEAVDFKYIWAFFVENPPRITDADGKMVQLPSYRTRAEGSHLPRSTNLAPGKEVELYEWTFDLQPNGENSSRSFIHGTGKFSLQCEPIVGPTWLNPDHPNPTLSKLATGKLELEIKSDPPPAAPVNETPQKKDRDEANMKPIKMGVYIEKVNNDTSTITASCVLIGAIDNVTKPLRFENLPVAEKAEIKDSGKEVKLVDLQLLPRDTPFYLFLKTYEFGGFEVVGIETIRK
jgi:RNA polymerase sigma factor (sigma-70 family)